MEPEEYDSEYESDYESDYEYEEIPPPYPGEYEERIISARVLLQDALNDDAPPEEVLRIYPRCKWINLNKACDIYEYAHKSQL